MNAGGDTQDSNTRDSNTQDSNTQDTDQESRGKQAPAATAAGDVLPTKAAEDDPRRWGDQPDSYDHDAWLQEQKPPHWG